MANLREAFASTNFASLEWDENKELAIDRVTASGLCDELGVLLWKAKYMNESVAYKSARTILINIHTERFINEVRLVAESVVEQCLHEYVSDRCRDCNGAKELMVGERRVICETCNGSGIRRYTDFERARTMKLALGKVQRIIRQFGYIQQLIGTKDRSVNVAMAALLERSY